MNEELKEWLTSIINEEWDAALQVGKVISDYFGDELVDVQASPDDVMRRALQGVTMSMLLSSIRHTSEYYIFKDDQNNTVSVSKQDYLDVRSKTILGNDIDPSYIPLIRKTTREIVTRFVRNTDIPIIIRFPRVTVTNENDKSIDITELYAKVLIRNTGRLYCCFQLMRTEYPLLQWFSNYSHSHMPSTDFSWQEPCLGGGPIRSTQNALYDRCDYDLWGLFCYELSKYVTVESLAGGPYRRLESVGNGSLIDSEYTHYNHSNRGPGSFGPLISDFISYFVHEFDFPVAFTGGAYVLGDSILNFVKNVTDFFAKWYNEQVSLGRYTFNLEALETRRFLRKVIIADGQIYLPSRRNDLNSVENLQGKELFLFKGEMVTANFIGDTSLNEDNAVLLINEQTISYLITKVLRILNYRYGEQERNSQSNNSETSTDKKHYFV